jgi:hypothetical protein
MLCKRRSRRIKQGESRRENEMEKLTLDELRLINRILRDGHYKGQAIRPKLSSMISAMSKELYTDDDGEWCECAKCDKCKPIWRCKAEVK